MRSLERGSVCIFAAVALLVGCQQRASQPPAREPFSGSSHAAHPKKSQTASKEPRNIVVERAKPPNLEGIQAPPYADFALSNEDPQVRIQAVSTLAEENSDPAAGTLATVVLSDTDPAVREEAVYALGEIGAESDVETLKQALTDPDDKVREAAIEVFADIGGEESVRSLAVALNDRNASVRAEAVDALGEIGGHTAVQLLQRAAKDREASIREAAAEYLAELSPRQK